MDINYRSPEESGGFKYSKIQGELKALRDELEAYKTRVDIDNIDSTIDTINETLQLIDNALTDGTSDLTIKDLTTTGNITDAGNISVSGTATINGNISTNGRLSSLGDLYTRDIYQAFHTIRVNSGDCYTPVGDVVAKLKIKTDPAGLPGLNSRPGSFGIARIEFDGPYYARLMVIVGPKNIHAFWDQDSNRIVKNIRIVEKANIGGELERYLVIDGLPTVFHNLTFVASLWNLEPITANPASLSQSDILVDIAIQDDTGESGGGGSIHYETAYFDDIEINNNFVSNGVNQFNNETHIHGSLDVDADTHFTGDTVIDLLNTDHIKDTLGHNIVDVDHTAGTMTFGNGTDHTHIVSNQRPTAAFEGKNDWHLATMEDVASGIEFQQVLDFFVTDPTFLPSVNPIVLKGNTSYLIPDGPISALIAGVDAFTVGQTAQIYNGVVAGNSITWTPGQMLARPLNNETYQWLARTTGDPTTVSTDGKWTTDKSTIFWHPDRAPFWSINENSMLGYRPANDQDIIDENIREQATTQTDWLEPDRLYVDPYTLNITTNPAYLRNKPIVGPTKLNGGDFTTQSASYQLIVRGGYTVPDPDPSSPYDNVIIQVRFGTEAQMRATHPDPNRQYEIMTTLSDTENIYQDRQAIDIVRLNKDSTWRSVGQTSFDANNDPNYRSIEGQPVILEDHILQAPAGTGALWTDITKFDDHTIKGQSQTNFVSSTNDIEVAFTEQQQGIPLSDRLSQVDLTINQTNIDSYVPRVVDVQETWTPGQSGSAKLTITHRNNNVNTTEEFNTLYDDHFTLSGSLGSALIQFNENELDGIKNITQGITNKEQSLTIERFDGTTAQTEKLGMKVPVTPDLPDNKRYFLARNYLDQLIWNVMPNYPTIINWTGTPTLQELKHLGVPVDLTPYIDIPDTSEGPVDWSVIQVSSDNSQVHFTVDPVAKTLTMLIEENINMLPTPPTVNLTVSSINPFGVAPAPAILTFDVEKVPMTQFGPQAPELIKVQPGILLNYPFDVDGEKGINWPYYDADWVINAGATIVWDTGLNQFVYSVAETTPVGTPITQPIESDGVVNTNLEIQLTEDATSISLVTGSPLPSTPVDLDLATWTSGTYPIDILPLNTDSIVSLFIVCYDNTGSVQPNYIDYTITGSGATLSATLTLTGTPAANWIFTVIAEARADITAQPGPLVASGMTNIFRFN